VPGLGDLLGTEAVPLIDLLIICVVAIAGDIAIRLDRVIRPDCRHAAGRYQPGSRGELDWPPQVALKFGYGFPPQPGC
jgi:Ca2+-transporting ATPase